jgi:hypothetical protein
VERVDLLGAGGRERDMAGRGRALDRERLVLLAAVPAPESQRGLPVVHQHVSERRQSSGVERAARIEVAHGQLDVVDRHDTDRKLREKS